MNRPVLTIPQVEQEYGVTRHTLKALVRSGVIAYLDAGTGKHHYYRFTRESLDALTRLRQNRVAVAGIPGKEDTMRAKFPEPRKIGIYWMVDFTFDGRRSRLRHGTLEAAMETAKYVWKHIKDGKDPRKELVKQAEKEKTASVTLTEYWQLFLKKHGAKLSKRTQESYAGSWKHVKKFKEIAQVAIRDLNPRAVERYMDTRILAGAATSTARTEGNLIRAMATFAFRQGAIERNPLSGRVEMPRVDNRREVSLSREQQRALLAAIENPLHRDIVEFAILSGKRKDEIFSLRVEDVVILPQDTQGVIRAQAVFKVKGGKHQSLYLSAQATEILIRHIGDRESGPVFVSKFGKRIGHTCLSSFELAVRELKLFAIQGGQRKPLNFHDLRRVALANSLEEGASHRAIQQQAGHKEFSTTERYLGTPDGKEVAEGQEKRRIS